MADLRLTRDFSTDVDTLWEYVTEPKRLLSWWGPEGVAIAEHELDFTRKGPWFSVMVNAKGERFKVSGHVTCVEPQTAVSFTWAWHDDADKRGPESHVTLSMEPLGDGRMRLIIDHRELADDEAALRHNEGWVSCLKKLERHFAPA